jgi:glycosyltransferase involved in cell wall biosynthesis
MDRIEFIIPTWEEPEHLKLILHSLILQTNPNWIAHVVIDGLTDEYREVKDMYQDEDRVRFSHLDSPHNDWGNTGRNYGLDNSKEDWIVMTSSDNYYIPTFVENFLGTITNSVDVVFCDFIHDLKRDEYQPIKSTIKEGWIDIGNVMYRRSIIGDLRLITESYQADFKFVNYIHKHKTKKIIKINKVLYVHN